MSNNIVQDIYDFNSKAGLLGKGMDSFMETSSVLEEAIKGYEDVFNQSEDTKTPVITARSWALGFLNQVKEAKEARKLPMPAEVEEVDKYVKITIIALSALAKLGKTPDEITQLINLEFNKQ